MDPEPPHQTARTTGEGGPSDRQVAAAGVVAALRSALSGATNARAALDLLLISFISLYLEVLLIRWLAAEIRLLAYFSNLTLIAAFLGLSVGCMARQSRIRWLPIMPFILSSLQALTLYFGRTSIIPDLKGQALWYVAATATEGWPISVVIVVFFLLVGLTFVPLGQYLGEALERFTPLVAYSINVLGSILGVLAFAVFSYLGTSSWIWFAVAFVALVGLRPGGRQYALGLGFAAVVAALVLVKLDPREVRWSPYHRVRLVEVYDHSGATPVLLGHQLFVNQDFYQFTLDLSETGPWRYSTYLANWRSLYDAPYRLGAFKNVLVVGSGTGNDVAAALRNGAEHVDAVDIDPVILDTGARLHPERPYDDPRVTVHCQDARVFLREAPARYDLIVMGFLDSQTLFSRMANVRLDTFVYTLEAFEELRNRLAPGGMLACSFATPRPWVATRLFGLVRGAFGTDPTVLRSSADPALHVYVVRRDGTAPAPPRSGDLVSVRFDSGALSATRPTTDDWPFFYLDRPRIPADYVKTLAVVLALAVLFLVASGPAGRRLHHRPMFFLGVGFLLLETLGITRLSLLYGSTWIVSSVVIVGFLVAILLANLVVLRRPDVRLATVYALLLASIVANALVPTRAFLALPLLPRVVLSTVLFCTPVLCAGIVFAIRFRSSGDIRGAFGANTLGAVCGGFLEYLSMATGFRALYIVVLAAYALSWTRERE